MKKYILAFLLFISIGSSAQTVRNLLGLYSNGMPGRIYTDTTYDQPNTTGRYLTGFGTWGSVLDTIRAAFSLTTTGTSGAATYNAATGVFNIPQYTGGAGTVTSVATGYGLTGGAITSSGTIVADTTALASKTYALALANLKVDVQVFLDSLSRHRDSSGYSLRYVNQVNDTTFSIVSRNGLYTRTVAFSLATTGNPVTSVVANGTGDSIVVTKYNGTINRIPLGASLWTASGTGAYLTNSGNVAVGGTNVANGRLALYNNNLGNPATGATTNEKTGLWIVNTTDATVGSQVQESGGLVFASSGWRTGSAVSDTTYIRFLNIPSTAGAAAVPNLYIRTRSTASGSWATAMSMNGGGSVTFTGQITGSVLNATSTSSQSTFAHGLYLYNSTTGRYIQFVATLANSIIGHENTTGNFQLRGNNSTSFATGTAQFVVGQSTGDVLINTTTFDNSAIINLTDTAKGLLIPRLTTTQRDSINLQLTGITVTNAGSGYTGTIIATLTTARYGEIAAVTNTPTKSGNTLASVPIVSNGSYRNTPAIVISGGGGTGATAVAVMTQVLPNGLLIYNTTTNKFQGVAGGAWVDLH